MNVGFRTGMGAVEVEIRDPRIVSGLQLALSKMVRAGLREPGVYNCGPGTDYPGIDHGFAAQYESMHAPHAHAQANLRPGAPNWLVGPRIYQIVSPQRPDPWRHPVSIRLMVRVVGTAWPDAPVYIVSSTDGRVFGIPPEVNAALQALQRHGYTDAATPYLFTGAELQAIGLSASVLQRLVTTPVPRATFSFARSAGVDRRGGDAYSLQLNVNLLS